jgi:hypothetical protein
MKDTSHFITVSLHPSSIPEAPRGNCRYTLPVRKACNSRAREKEIRDHSTGMSELYRQKYEKIARTRCDRLLRGQTLSLDKDSLKSIKLILSHTDCFVSQCRGNESIEKLYLDPYVSFDRQDDGFWDKVGQAVGNLQALKTIYIDTYSFYEQNYDDDESHSDNDTEDEDGNLPYWEKVLPLILRHVRQKVLIDLGGSGIWDVEESRMFAQAIRRHPSITSFKSCYNYPYESLDDLHSALATLPALESIALSWGRHDARPEDEFALANPESLTELLQIPTLRFVDFSHCFFTHALCQATANAFAEGAAVTKVEFMRCKFSTEESAAIMANGLSRNTSVISITVASPWDGTLHSALAMALPLNSTLKELSSKANRIDTAHIDWSPIFLALGQNTGLKILSIVADLHFSMDESLCTAMQNGLGKNETLESLELNRVPLCVDNADLMSRAFSFIRANKALKSLVVELKDDTIESLASAFRLDVAAMLEENTSLVSLSIPCWNAQIKAKEYLVFVTALQHNRTLKTLSINHQKGHLTLTDDEDKQMAALLQKNYALESLPGIYLESSLGDVGAILQLNKAGRRYLIEDGSSVSKGVKVLSAVSDEIDCVFLHLLENPRLCDRSAVEAAASGSTCTDYGGSASLEASLENQTVGKREHGHVQTEGKESRRRLT